MNRAIFVELTDGRIAVNVALEARIHAAALCSDLQAALRNIESGYRPPSMSDADYIAHLQAVARVAVARAKGAA